jgi:hypothetical protein
MARARPAGPGETGMGKRTRLRPPRWRIRTRCDRLVGGGWPVARPDRAHARARGVLRARLLAAVRRRARPVAAGVADTSPCRSARAAGDRVADRGAPGPDRALAVLLAGRTRRAQRVRSARLGDPLPRPRAGLPRTTARARAAAVALAAAVRRAGGGAEGRAHRDRGPRPPAGRGNVAHRRRGGRAISSRSRGARAGARCVGSGHVRRTTTPLGAPPRLPRGRRGCVPGLLARALGTRATRGDGRRSSGGRDRPGRIRGLPARRRERAAVRGRRRLCPGRRPTPPVRGARPARALVPARMGGGVGQPRGGLRRAGRGGARGRRGARRAWRRGQRRR